MNRRKRSEGDESRRNRPGACAPERPPSRWCAPSAERRRRTMSSSTSKVSKAASLAFLQALSSGLQKHLANQSFPVGPTTTYNVTTLVQLLGSLIAAIE